MFGLEPAKGNGLEHGRNGMMRHFQY